MRATTLAAALACTLLSLAAAQDAPAPKVLFTTSITVSGTPVPLAVSEGDSPLALATAFGAKYGLPDDGVAVVTKHIMEKAGRLVKHVFFHLPFYAEVLQADGQRKSQLMNLTVYEDSSPSELAAGVAKKFALPKSGEDRLKIEVEAQMVKRIQLRIMVDLQDGLSKQALLVYRNENAAIAARRFSLQHGVSAMGQKNLEAHIMAQLDAKPPAAFADIGKK